MDTKYRSIQAYFGVPMVFVASTLKNSPFRKPNKGMWDLLLNSLAVYEN